MRQKILLFLFLFIFSISTAYASTFGKIKKFLFGLGGVVVSEIVGGVLGANEAKKHTQTLREIKGELSKLQSSGAIPDSEYREILAMAQNLEFMISTVSEMNVRLSNMEKTQRQMFEMLSQQNEVIMRTNGISSISGEDFLYKFYSLAKAVGTDQTYKMLSGNAQTKLPYGSYRAWWNKTVHSVYVDNVKPVGNNVYEVYLSYNKKDGGYQCSKDLIQLSPYNGNWLIHNFEWGYC